VGASLLRSLFSKQRIPSTCWRFIHSSSRAGMRTRSLTLIAWRSCACAQSSRKSACLFSGLSHLRPSSTNAPKLARCPHAESGGTERGQGLALQHRQRRCQSSHCVTVDGCLVHFEIPSQIASRGNRNPVTENSDARIGHATLLQARLCTALLGGRGQPRPLYSQYSRAASANASGGLQIVQ
jgi:hypothetical protein